MPLQVQVAVKFKVGMRWPGEKGEEGVCPWGDRMSAGRGTLGGRVWEYRSC